MSAFRQSFSEGKLSFMFIGIIMPVNLRSKEAEYSFNL